MSFLLYCKLFCLSKTSHSLWASFSGGGQVEAPVMKEPGNPHSGEFAGLFAIQSNENWRKLDRRPSAPPSQNTSNGPNGIKAQAYTKGSHCSIKSTQSTFKTLSGRLSEPVTLSQFNALHQNRLGLWKALDLLQTSNQPLRGIKSKAQGGLRKTKLSNHIILRPVSTN